MVRLNTVSFVRTKLAVQKNRECKKTVVNVLTVSNVWMNNCTLKRFVS